MLKDGVVRSITTETLSKAVSSETAFLFHRSFTDFHQI